MCLKILIFKVLYFLKMCPIFVGSAHDLVKKYLFYTSAWHKWFLAQLTQKILDVL